MIWAGDHDANRGVYSSEHAAAASVQSALASCLRSWLTRTESSRRRPADLRNVQGIGIEVAESICVVEIPCQARGRDRARRAALELQSSRRQIPPTPPCSEKSTTLLLSSMYGEASSDPHAIGIVGTRSPSHYAGRMRQKLAYQLAYAGLTVVSGLGSRNRYGGAPSCARGEGSNCRRPRQRIRRSLSS